MRLWRIRPAAHPGDTAWQDHPIWEEVVVRAETAAMARILAGQMEEQEARGTPPAGNESVSIDSGFDGPWLYRVVQLDADEAAELSENGPRQVLYARKLREGRRW